LRAAQRVLESRDRRRNRRDDELFVTLCAAVLRADSNCVDVGANEGHLLRHVVRLAPHGCHVAFEPVPELAAALAQEFPGCDVRQVALADHRGSAAFVHDLHAPSLSGFQRGSHRPEASRDLIVTVDSLDMALPDDLRPALVKVDVEGAELPVLRGARATLARARPVVVFEHGDAAHSAEVHALFEALDYAVLDMDGNGPFDAHDFAATVAGGERWNWFARPR